MSSFLTFITAVCTGISAGCFFYLGAKAVSGAKLDAKEQESTRNLPILMRLLRPLCGLFRPVASRSELSAWKSSCAVNLKMAGFTEDEFNGEDYLAMRFVFFAISLFMLILGVFSGRALIMFIMAILFAFYPEAWLRGEIKRRHTAIMKALPNVLDLLTLSVESGRDLISSLRDILAKRRKDPLGEELLRTFHEIQLGRKRTEALRALSERVRQVDLTATVNAIIQAEELGVSIGKQLRIQSDSQRAKRFSLAEKLANEASVKIIIPVVVFILPAVFIILLGPLAVQTARMFR